MAKRVDTLALYKAPSERGLPTESGGGECETMEFAKIFELRILPQSLRASSLSEGAYIGAHKSLNFSVCTNKFPRPPKTDHS